MKRNVFLFVIALSIYSCINRQSKIQQVEGKYINTFEKNSIHYVELKKDSTYFYYYKGKNGEMNNKDVWFKTDKQHHYEILFKSWKDIENEKEVNWVVDLVGNELQFDNDAGYKRNFTKKR